MSETLIYALDPDQVVTVRIGQAEFDLAAVPSGIWKRLKFEQVRAYEDAHRNAIRDLAARGLDPEEKVAPDSTHTRAHAAVRTDPSWQELMARVAVELLRWSLRAHRGFCFSDGRPVPLERATVTYEGEPHQVLAPATLAVYRRNHRLADVLASRVQAISELGVDEKKGSPPPPSSTGSSSTAEGAPQPPASSS